ncbi:hypothetical protein BgiMline_016569 [Biomphalaria glabrata]|nr:hypothetical protein BgiMline_009375 [Biomphalaria glabrata]KAI8792257.1 hypothetical protein BgiBS90_007721 [Biomphalaria glabrata]
MSNLAVSFWIVVLNQLDGTIAELSQHNPSSNAEKREVEKAKCLIRERSVASVERPRHIVLQCSSNLSDQAITLMRTFTASHSNLSDQAITLMRTFTASHSNLSDQAITMMPTFTASHSNLSDEAITLMRTFTASHSNLSDQAITLMPTFTALNVKENANRFRYQHPNLWGKSLDQQN